MNYINEYSKITPKERRQLAFKRRYKNERPEWDDSMILLKNLLNKQLTPKATVLDYGCGHGNYVLDELGDIFSKKIGIDIDEESVTNNISVDSVILCKDSLLPFPDAFFDVVISLWVLEHVEDPTKLFDEVSRVLKHGGLFVFVTPNRHSFLIILRRLMNKKIADRLLKLLYGREEQEVFPTWYQANTTRALAAQAARVSLRVETIHENVDPSYTSFGRFSYGVSKIFSSISLSLFRPHIIGIFKKRNASLVP